MVFPAILADVQTGTIVVVPLGKVGPAEIESVRRALVRTFVFHVQVAARRPLPRETFYPPRHRYRAEHIDAWLARTVAGDKVLGVTRADISTTARGHKDWGIAGLGLLSGRAAVVSSFRAKRQLDEVAVHEIGHTLGLPHCPHAGCIMQDANGKVDRIGNSFCETCREKIRTSLRKRVDPLVRPPRRFRNFPGGGDPGGERS